MFYRFLSNTRERKINMKTHKSLLKILKVSIFLSIFTSMLCSAKLSAEPSNEDSLTIGKNLLAQNKAREALAAFEEVARSNNSPQEIYLYIGLAQLKLGEYNSAIDSFARGKNIDVANFHIYSFNMGNAFFAQNKFYDAEISYNEALSSGKIYPKAILNRANTRMKIEKYRHALSDYKAYLQASPGDAQEEEVRLMIAALENAQLQEDAQRDALLQEATRRAEQAMRAAEKERQRKLLEEINSSLSSVEDSNSISSGTEDTINYEEENDLD